MALDPSDIFDRLVRKKSTALQPFLWLATIISSAIAGSATAGAPEGVLYVETGLLAVVVGGFLRAYFRLLKEDPSALRSEPFHFLEKAYKHGWVGDSRTGAIVDPENLPSQMGDEE